jgi:D-beta-D-heptose 7-phosphate kinase/D-beta-D-heptose 1-phosphate adenosyltransferase
MSSKIKEKKKYFQILKEMENKNILIIGDIMLDKYILGNVERISPEAPVPIIHTANEQYILGGATNVANNIKSLNANPTILGVIGDDGIGRMLKELIEKNSIDTSGLIIDKTRPTTVKTRIIARNQQILRIDNESNDTLHDKYNKKILSYLNKNIHKFDAIIISDYGKGLISENLMKEITKITNRENKIISVDPKVKNFFFYKDVTLITPNNLEASQASNISIIDDKTLNSCANKLLTSLNCENLLITRGENGMSLFNKKYKKPKHIPTFAKEVYDVTGAGDTVIATCTLSMTTKCDIVDSIILSNFAAGIVVGKRGTATVNSKEIIDYIKEH